MTAQDILADAAGDARNPAANVDLDHGDTLEETIAKLKHEEVVFALQEPKDDNGGYLIYSLSEGSTSDEGHPFRLEVVQCQQHQLPEGFSGLVIDQGSLPPPHLRSPRQAHVVVSTRSGLRLAQDFYQHILRPLLGAVGLGSNESEGQEGYLLTVTKTPNTIRDFARELGRDENAADKTVILLSGDGGVVDLLNGLDHASPSTQSSPPPTIALLPLGTANALFHSLHKPHYASPTAPSPLVLALRTLFRGTASPLPTFQASFSPGARLISAPVDHHHHHPVDQHADGAAAKDHEKETPVTHLIGAIVASYGFHASLVWESDTPAYRVHGDKRFGMAAGELLKVAHAYEAAVEVRRAEAPGFVPLLSGGSSSSSSSSRNSSGGGEGKGTAGRFDYVLATLVSNLEKTFAISPASRPLDGRLRLVHFGDVGGDKTMEIMMAAYRDGEHVGMAEVGYEEVEEVKVTIAEEDARWRKVCVDGSIVEIEKGGWMRVSKERRERLRVLVDV